MTKVVRVKDLATVRLQIAGATVVTVPDPLSGFVNSSGVSREVTGATVAHLTTQGVRWTTTMFAPEITLVSPPQTYRSGRNYMSQANRAVFGPALPAGESPWVARFHPSTSDDLIFMDIPLFGDSTGNGGFSTVDSASVQLFRGAELVGEVPDTSGAFVVPAEEADYRLVATATRSLDLSTKVSAEWAFRSSRTGDRITPIDVSVVRFTPKLDATNAARPGAFQIPVALQRADGSMERPCTLTVDVSYDEGQTWRPATVSDGKVKVRHPEGAKSVSLRASATDQNGNTVRQTIIRAYKIA